MLAFHERRHPHPRRHGQGDLHAAAQLLPLVYDEPRRLAALKLANEKPGLILDATALVQ